MPVEVTVEGAENIKSFGDSMVRARKAFEDRLEKTLMRFNDNVIYTTKRKYLAGPRPEKLDIVTGRLASSITGEVKRENHIFSAIVGTNVWYGKLHELGIGKMPKRAFLRPAVEDNLKTLELDLRDLMDMVLTDAPA